MGMTETMALTMMELTVNSPNLDSEEDDEITIVDAQVELMTK
jgi:hypothetical protein